MNRDGACGGADPSPFGFCFPGPPQTRLGQVSCETLHEDTAQTHPVSIVGLGAVAHTPGGRKGKRTHAPGRASLEVT